MVSFSGGKDSLACLLLTMDAGLRLPIFFVDTGLEFPETIAHVDRMAEKHRLQLIEESAPEGIFFESLVHFGPPRKGFPLVLQDQQAWAYDEGEVMKHYPHGVLSLYWTEALSIRTALREAQGMEESLNCLGQIGASPIQDWTALHVWLYIFSKGEEYNPWYDRGLDRIGMLPLPCIRSERDGTGERSIQLLG